MCVIFCQSKSNENVTLDEFCKMQKKNPDGMGYMAIVNGKLIFEKGFKSVYDFYDKYLQIKNNQKCKQIACHFRYATGSEKNDINCHPFIITDDKEEIKQTEGVTDALVMHNGIMGNSTKEFSDTALYVMNNLAERYKIDSRFWRHMEGKELRMFYNEIAGNRFLFASKEGMINVGAGWSIYKNKAVISNLYWNF